MMIVGYFDNDAQVFCPSCWAARAEAGARPAKILDSEDPLQPEANFWIVDVCVECGAKVKYMTDVAVN
jgi:hypothetical protein